MITEYAFATFDVVRNIQTVLALIRITAYLPGYIRPNLRCCEDRMSLAVEQYRKNPINPPSEIGLSACAIG